MPYESVYIKTPVNIQICQQVDVTGSEETECAETNTLKTKKLSVIFSISIYSVIVC